MNTFKGTFVGFLLLTLAGICPGQGAKTQGRVAFAEALAKVNSRMTADEVRALLGEPDDILNEGEAYLCGLSDYGVNVQAVWAYGTNGHLTFPTLGMVGFAGKGSGTPFNMLSWSKSPPIPDGVVEENELRTLLRTLDHGLYGNHVYEGAPADPLSAIRIANAFIPLGRQKAAQVLREFARIEPFLGNDMTVIDALRLGFTFEPGAAVPKISDYPSGPVDKDNPSRGFNQDPFIIFNDLPFDVSNQSAGIRQWDYLRDMSDVLEKSGSPRGTLLKPFGDLTKMADQVEALPVWAEAVKAWEPLGGKNAAALADSKLKYQLLLLARTALPLHIRPLQSTDVNGVITYSWGSDVKELAGKPVSWSEATQSFVVEGAPTPAAESDVVTSQSWTVPCAEGYGMRVLVIRANSHVYTVVRWFDPPSGMDSFKVRVMSNDPEPTLQEIGFPLPVMHGSLGSHDWGESTATLDDGSTWHEVSMMVPLDGAQGLYVEVERADSIRRSPIFKFD